MPLCKGGTVDWSLESVTKYYTMYSSLKEMIHSSFSFSFSFSFFSWYDFYIHVEVLEMHQWAPIISSPVKPNKKQIWGSDSTICTNVFKDNNAKEPWCRKLEVTYSQCYSGQVILTVSHNEHRFISYVQNIIQSFTKQRH